MPNRIIRCVLSGSYRKDIQGLHSAYNELTTCGCQVLSPHRLEFIDNTATFVKDKAEENISDEIIERHHLLAITQSNFVWLHAPEGHVGTSASFEIGFALAHNIPVFSAEAPQETILVPFIKVVPSVYQAISNLSG